MLDTTPLFSMLGLLLPLLHFARTGINLLSSPGTPLMYQSAVLPTRRCKKELLQLNPTRMLSTGISYDSTKIEYIVNQLRMECSDMTGIPQWSAVLTASISPTCTDESIMYNLCDDDATLGLQGSLSRVICGLPGYTIIHLFDRGFL